MLRARHSRTVYERRPTSAPSPMNLVLEESIQAPQRVVWQVITDLEGAPRRIAGIKSLEVLTAGPVGKGTRFRETRVMFGKEAVEEMEITRFEAPTSYTVEADSCGAHFVSTYSLREVAGTTTLRLEIRTHANTLFAKLMAPLGFLMAGSMKKAIAKDNADIKRAAEELR
jgi:carbon monoxide dehydrogenase subunit G